MIILFSLFLLLFIIVIIIIIIAIIFSTSFHNYNDCQKIEEPINCNNNDNNNIDNDETMSSKITKNHYQKQKEEMMMPTSLTIGDHHHHQQQQLMNQFDPNNHDDDGIHRPHHKRFSNNLSNDENNDHFTQNVLANKLDQFDDKNNNHKTNKRNAIYFAQRSINCGPDKFTQADLSSSELKMFTISLSSSHDDDTDNEKGEKKADDSQENLISREKFANDNVIDNEDAEKTMMMINLNEAHGDGNIYECNEEKFKITNLNSKNLSSLVELEKITIQPEAGTENHRRIHYGDCINQNKNSNKFVIDTTNNNNKNDDDDDKDKKAIIDENDNNDSMLKILELKSTIKSLPNQIIMLNSNPNNSIEMNDNKKANRDNFNLASIRQSIDKSCLSDDELNVDEIKQIKSNIGYGNDVQKLNKEIVRLRFVKLNTYYECIEQF
ncbi:hypothetical protein DERF_011319 [Dermatophagoides farinae]|uniref:Uncharacterized protein n=1 Tax=Dermatophagoides farinae TaxID=6954 RepID=A0A922HVW8_DERFA|nr:hypothetical protein DERF_011319 [Dermatophagoides farinae]